MNDLIQISFTMNAYLFGCMILLAFWFLTWGVLKLKGKTDQLPEFWWASFFCAAWGITEPLFVPEYWTPPSILKFGRWDFESFIFCFAVGGIASVIAEISPIKNRFVDLYSFFEKILRFFLASLSRLTNRKLHASMLKQWPQSYLIPKEKTKIENMFLMIFFLGMFGATSQFGLNIIYDTAIVCIATALFIAWRRPSLRWQILGGGISFTGIYSLVLLITDFAYPDFYSHWNQEELSGFWILGAPAEEYLFSFTFGAFFAPLYEAWKQIREN